MPHQKPGDNPNQKFWYRKNDFCNSDKKNGDPCGQRAVNVRLKGKIYKLETCIMHASPAIRKHLDLITPPTGRANTGRKKTPTPHSILKARFEADADRYLKPLEDALTAMKAVVVGNGASAHIEFTEDLALRISAVEKMLDRIYGRPKQQLEHTGSDGHAIEVNVPSDDKRVQDVAAVLAQVGAVPAPPALVIPENASSKSPSSN